MAKKKSKKSPVYLAIDKSYKYETQVYYSKKEMFKAIESGDASPSFFKFYAVGGSVKISVKIVETIIKKKSTKAVRIK